MLFRSVLVYERINRRDRAFEELEAMRVQGQGQIRGEVHLDPDLEELRKDRRYQLFASGTAAGQTNQKAK